MSFQDLTTRSHSGPGLFFVRLGWLILATAVIVIFAAALPYRFAQLQTVSPQANTRVGELLQAAVAAAGGQPVPILVVLTTLLIAALFNPLRKRIQDYIDRRFYRQKYDAEKALAQFANAARSETDLDRLTEGMVQVAQETLQPEKVLVCLTPSVKETAQ